MSGSDELAGYLDMTASSGFRVLSANRPADLDTHVPDAARGRDGPGPARFCRDHSVGRVRRRRRCLPVRPVGRRAGSRRRERPGSGDRRPGCQRRRGLTGPRLVSPRSLRPGRRSPTAATTRPPDKTHFAVFTPSVFSRSRFDSASFFFFRAVSWSGNSTRESFPLMRDVSSRPLLNMAAPERFE